MISKRSQFRSVDWDTMTFIVFINGGLLSVWPFVGDLPKANLEKAENIEIPDCF